MVFYIFNSLIIFTTAAGVNLSGGVMLGGGGSAPTQTVTITNTLIHTQIVVQVVTNGQIVHRPLPMVVAPTSLLTNRVSKLVPAAKVGPRFFEQWH